MLVGSVALVAAAFFAFAPDPTALKVQGPDTAGNALLTTTGGATPTGKPTVAIASNTNAADASSAGFVFNNVDSGVSAAFANMIFNGATWDRQRSPNIFKPQNAVAVNPEATVWTPGAGKKFRVVGYIMTGSVVGNYVFKDNTAGTTIFIVPIGTAGVGIATDWRNGILSAAANNVLTCTGPAASTLSGTIYGNEE